MCRSIHRQQAGTPVDFGDVGGRSADHARVCSAQSSGLAQGHRVPALGHPFSKRQRTSRDASSSGGGGGGKPPKRQRCSQDTRAKSNLLENCRVTSCKSIGDAQNNTAQVTPEKFVMALQREALLVKSERDGTPLLRILRGSVVGATFDDKGVVVSATVSCDDGQKRCISCTALVAAMGPWTGRAKDWGGAFSQIPPVEGLKAHSIVMKSEGVSPVAVFCNFPGEDGKEKEVEFYPRPNGTTYWCGEADDWHAPVTEEPGHVTPDPNAVAKLIQRGSELSAEFLGAGSPERVAACHLPVVCSDDGGSREALVCELREGSRAFVATGHSCWGILQAPSTGKAVADLIATGKSTLIDLSGYAARHAE